MKNIRSFLSVSACALLLSGVSAFAAGGEYQVTGSVTAVNDTSISLLKGKEAFVIARDAKTPVTGGDVKVGDKVTVYYTITATKMENKGAEAKKPAASPAAASGSASPAAAAASPAKAKAKP